MGGANSKKSKSQKIVTQAFSQWETLNIFQERARFVDSSEKCHRPLECSICVAKARSYVICLAGPCRTLRCGTAPGDGNVHMGSLSVKPKGRSQWQKIKIAQNRDAVVFSMGNVELFFRNAPDLLIPVKSAIGPLMVPHASRKRAHMSYV